MKPKRMSATAKLLRKAPIAIAAMLSSFVCAQSPPITFPSYEEPAMTVECDKNEAEIARCAHEKAKHSSEHLDSLVAEVTASQPFESRVPAFKEANDAWRKYREASCTFDADGAFGSSKTYRYWACTHAYNKARIELLQKYLACLRGKCSNDVQLYYFVSPSAKRGS